MAEYNKIKGLTIQAFDEDPGSPSSGTWASGGTITTARSELGGAVQGTQSAGLIFGGQPPESDKTESYNGSAWSEVNDLNTARGGQAGAGTQSAALCISGYDPTLNDAVEQWDGTNWSEVGDLNTARNGPGGVGTTSAALCIGGYTPPPARTVDVEQWNVTGWTEIANLNTARAYLGAAGTTSAALAIFGQDAPPTPNVTGLVESWNGTAWTEVADGNTARYANVGFGIQTAALTMAGTASPPRHVLTEHFDGTSWTEVADMTGKRADAAGGGSSINGLIGAGSDTSEAQLATSEEWTVPSSPVAQEGQLWYNLSQQKLKGYAATGTGAWASGAVMNQARLYLAGAGTSQSACIAFGGAIPGGARDFTELYDGTAWTEVNDLNTGREQLGGLSAGSTLATATVGGVSNSSPVVIVDTTEEWNGTSWTAGNDISYSSYKTQGAGTLTSGIAFGGGSEPWAILATSAVYDGTTWTANASLNVGKVKAAAFGSSSNNAICAAGENPSTGYSVTCEQFNGTAWAEVGDNNTGRNNIQGRGSSTLGLIVGGEIGGPTYASQKITEAWNGSAWTEVADMANISTAGTTGGGTYTSAVHGGGNDGSPTDATEEWRIPNEINTVTVS